MEAAKTNQSLKLIRSVAIALSLTAGAQIAAADAPSETSVKSLVPGLDFAKTYDSVEQMEDRARYNELVKFRADVKRIQRDNDLVVQDASGSVSVDVNEMPLPLRTGDTVWVTGRIDKEVLGIEIIATEIIHDGRTYAIDRYDDR